MGLVEVNLSDFQYIGMSSIDICGIFSQVVNCKVKNGIIGKLIVNPITLALLMTILVVLVMYIGDIDEFKTKFRVFVVAICCIFLNNYLITCDKKSPELDDIQKNISTNKPGLGGDHIGVEGGGQGKNSGNSFIIPETED